MGGPAAAVRDAVEARCGAPVVRAESQRGGFTPGFASRLLLADGRRIFVKAADECTRPLFAEAYRREAAFVPRLPEGVPVPRVQWVHGHDGWVVVAFDDVDGRHPVRPWRRVELDRVLGVLASLAATVTPVPAALELPTFAAEFGALPSLWEELPDDPRAGQTTTS